MKGQPLTLLVAKRLLQHRQDDRVVQHEVAEVAESSCTQSGVANQRVFIQKTAGGGSPAGGGKSAQHLHDTRGHRHRKASVSRPTTQLLTLINHQVTLTRKAPKPKCDITQRQQHIVWSLTRITSPLQRPWPSWMPGCAPSRLYGGLPAPVWICCQRFRAPQSPTPQPSSPVHRDRQKGGNKQNVAVAGLLIAILENTSGFC